MIVVGNLIFSGSYNGSLLVWNLKTGTLVRHVDSAHAAVIRGIKVGVLIICIYCFFPFFFAVAGQWHSDQCWGGRKNYGVADARRQ